MIETLSAENLKYLTPLVLELWPGSVFDEEYENYKDIPDSENEICYLVKNEEMYIGFIHLSIRTNYVEGAAELPVAYLEAIYVKAEYRKTGIGEKLLALVENWAKEKGYSQIASDTELENSASIDFHKKVGFNEANRIVCFIKELY